ncbi:metallophosphoesterase [Streptomyces meridianus]|uniref:Metallophosphoesterase n=1 Tax=Streptomyces meridianus TaxID=2938945 RepID=A0ABT0X5X6_9ACTN|nr:metallophosphoesterase [Streptomyces meridianus]MCM2577945.1 metallophosphoesterase [Streptomyces meridianus]
MAVLVVVIVIAVLTLLAGVHRYLWIRLVRDTTAGPGPVRRTGAAVAFALPLITLSALISRRGGAPFRVEQILAWPGYLWLACLLYITLALLVGEAVRPLLRRALERRAAARATGENTAPARVPEPVTAVGALPADPAAGAPYPAAGDRLAAAPAGDGAPAPGAGSGPDGRPSRRLFVARTVGLAAAAAGMGTVAYGAHGVLDGPTVKRTRITLAKLPRSADGYRVAVVSDIHLGPMLGRSHTRRIVDAVNGTRPDLVAIVGDLVDGTVADLGPAAEPLVRLRSRHGTYFVTGNHEYYSGAAEWVDHLRDLGVHPLENARVELPGFDLAGVNDVAAEGEGPTGAGPDFRAALGDRDPARASVLLAHQPVLIHDAVKHGVDLQLSGHTHGGQLWPGPYLAALANPTVAGLERYGDTQLYVTRGAGAWGPPVRVGAESDITLVTLKSP